MKKEIAVRIGVIALILVLLVIFVLVLLGMLESFYFWIAIVIAAIIAFWVLPKISKK